MRIALFWMAGMAMAQEPRPLPPPEEIARLPPDGGPEFNRLIFEKSPYLLQHARNPVDWYPWGEAAFERARREDKPIFFSSGYSSCHWCHVMERESFEDAEVAKLLNEKFVCIKLDREEREDVDQVYMDVCMAMNGHGGWPLTILMTPDKTPFFAGTYLPKRGRGGRIGLMELLERVADLWAKDRERLLSHADRIVEAVRRPRETEGTLTRETLVRATDQLRERVDEDHGGLGDAPKFPLPHVWTFLLRRGETAPAEQTLQAMRRGGIFDHVGFGFHRYSTDRQWLVPHFEKMLYDQALLLIAYTEAFQATGKPLYAATAREIADYVTRALRSPEGGFYCSEDADSEGEEGRFYLWTRDEFLSAAGEEGERLAGAFGIEAGGNFEVEATGERNGGNILHLRKPLAEATGWTEEEARLRWEAARKRLFEIREKRVHPSKDDKILAGWNGLMIAALAEAGRTLGESAMTEAARAAAEFVLGKMRREGRLLRRYRQGEAAVPAFLDDYAFFEWGLLELYESTFDVRWVREAAALQSALDERFWDAADGGYFFSAEDGEKLLFRKKEVYDGALPSGNSVAALNLLRLSAMTGDGRYRERAERLFRALGGEVARAPSAHTQFLIALDWWLGPVREVAIAGRRGAEDTEALLRETRTRFLPRTVVLFRPEGEDVGPLAERLSSAKMVEGKAAAYVCVDSACRAPVTDPRELARALEAPQGRGKE